MSEAVVDAERFVLGAVQFGMKYGLNNSRGKVPLEEVSEILDACQTDGIGLIDTAQSYGNSETVLGEIGAARKGFNFVTKVRAGESKAAELVDASFARLKVSSLYGVLMHDCSELRREEGQKIYRELIHLQGKGLINKVGVSVYSEQDLRFALETVPVDLVQLPFSIIDQRFLTSGLLDELAEKGIEVHARSVFLKGLLLKEWEQLPQYFSRFENEMTRFYAFCAETGKTRMDASLGFVSSVSQVSKIIIGVNGLSQIRELLKERKSFHNSEIRSARKLTVSDEALWNPQRWEV